MARTVVFKYELCCDFRLAKQNVYKILVARASHGSNRFDQPRSLHGGRVSSRSPEDRGAAAGRSPGGFLMGRASRKSGAPADSVSGRCRVLQVRETPSNAFLKNVARISRTLDDFLPHRTHRRRRAVLSITLPRNRVVTRTSERRRFVELLYVFRHSTTTA